MKPAIGASDFKQLRMYRDSTGNQSLYIDKTLLIKDIVDDPSVYILITRPRRFGKTLNMSMLKHFFHEKVDIFDNLNITKYLNIVEEHQGKRPTIFLTFKGVKGEGDFQSLKVKYLKALYEAIIPFKDIVEYNISDLLKDYSYEPPFVTHASSIKHVCEQITEKLGVKPLVICDEYDTPSNDAYNAPYLKEVIKMMKDFFESTFKDNNYIYKGIITGINRIAKENIFSGLNGLNTCSITDEKYSKYFGFTEDEINSLDLISSQKDEVKKWYNGYNFGGTIIYNPWSILMYIDKGFKIGSYWANSGSTGLIEESLTPEVSGKMHALIDNQSIDIRFQEHMVYNEIKASSDVFFSLLYNAGYLTSVEKPIDLNNLSKITLRIVNKEIHEEILRLYAKWLTNNQTETFLVELIDDFVEGNLLAVEEKLQNIALNIFSFNDVSYSKQESFYHGFVLGISIGAQDRFIIKSNRESGHGRYDIAWYPKDTQKDPGIIIELKVDGSSAEEALQQIDIKQYEADILQYGSKKILKYGIHFNGKKLKVLKG